MPQGHVSSVKVGEGNATVNLYEEGLFYLWATGWFTEPMSWLDSLKYSMWISLLKEALANHLEVELSTDDEYSSLVTSVKLIGTYHP